MFSDNKYIKFFQILSFLFLIVVFFQYYINIDTDTVFKYNYILSNDVWKIDYKIPGYEYVFINKLTPTEFILNSEVVNMDPKIAWYQYVPIGTEISKGSYVGFAATVGALMAGVSKTIAKTKLPPIQKAGIVIASGIVGGYIYVVVVHLIIYYLFL